MSANNYVISGYGLVITDTDKHINYFLKTIEQAWKQEDSDTDDWNLFGMNKVKNFFEHKQDIVNIAEFSNIDEDKFFVPISDETNAIEIEEDDNGLIFYTDKQPNICEQAYGSEDEIIKEFKEKLGKFLPDDFDYKAHIGELSWIQIDT